ncbi:MAG: FAD-dependent thymidylate synthase, partial [Acidobacteria bacterium]|nr:FAD-dependent thymidylate synthase [Acidobacteriota bacterium]
MEVILAGMNLDMETLREMRRLLTDLRRQAGESALEKTAALLAAVDEFTASDNLTPETLSAAYARISRDPRPVNELRRVARAEVDRARKSNETIIFGLGHASVAEHAVFNLDILGVSRLALEFIEHFRLCSYTEKSQRYITLDGDFVTPVEVLGTVVEEEFRAMVERQNRTYFRFYERLQTYFFDSDPEMAGQKAGRRTLDGWAKEDARYCLCLATEAQLGMTANARNLERIIQKAAAHPLGEVKEFGARLYRELRDIVPSLIKHTAPEPYHLAGLPAFREGVRRACATRVDGREFPASLISDIGPTGRRMDALEGGTGGAPAAGSTPEKDRDRLELQAPAADRSLDYRWEETFGSGRGRQDGVEVTGQAGDAGSEAARCHTGGMTPAETAAETTETGMPSCRLVSADADAEARIFAAVAHEAGRDSFDRCLAWARRLSVGEKDALLGELRAHLRAYHGLPRAFEYATVTFECVMSASCYAQFKRHRMGTMTVQEYDPALGVTVPPSIQAVGLAGELRDLAAASAAVAARLAALSPPAAPYILTNAHRRRVLFQVNFRELVHFMRLRRDAHAQWDIRHLAAAMAAAL